MLKTLENGIKRFPEAPAFERVKANLYQAELAVRTKNFELSRSSFDLAKSIELTDDEKTAVSEEFDHIAGLLDQDQELNTR